MHPHVTKKKKSKVNIFKSAASVAHMRTACSLSCAADDFFSEKKTLQNLKNEREEKWWAGAPPIKNSSSTRLAEVLPPWLQTPACLRRRDQLTKRFQHVSEKRDRNQSRLAGYNLISRRRRRRLRSERATPQPTAILMLICWGRTRQKSFLGCLVAVWASPVAGFLHVEVSIPARSYRARFNRNSN